MDKPTIAIEEWSRSLSLPTRRTFFEGIVSRCVLFAIAYAAAVIIPTQTGDIYHHISNNPLVDMWWRWDALRYNAIAINGYGWQYGQWNDSATFFPAFPLLLNPILGALSISNKATALIIGVLASNIFLVASMVFLNWLALLDLDMDTVQHGRWLIWAAPMAIFFSGMYTESMFLFTSILALYYSRRGHWFIALLAAFLAGLTRTAGLALVLPLAYESWCSGPKLKHLPAITGPVFAFALYVLLVGWRLGDWSAYFQIASTAWSRTLSIPWLAFTRFFDGQPVLFGFQNSVFDLTFTIVFLILSLAAFRIRFSYGLFAVGIVVLPLLSGILVSMPRYTAVAFPAYLVIADFIRTSRKRQIVVYVTTIFLAIVGIARFVNWYWVA